MERVPLVQGIRPAGLSPAAGQAEAEAHGRATANAGHVLRLRPARPTDSEDGGDMISDIETARGRSGLIGGATEGSYPARHKRPIITNSCKKTVAPTAAGWMK